MNKVVLYCRPGFEKECAAEITDKAAKREIFGFARVKENAGYVVFECYQPEDADKLARELPFSSLIFARQMFVAGELLKDLPPEDRITPIVGMLQGVVEKGGDLRVEVADTNESKELMKFCRKFTVPLRAALREAGVLTNYETPKRPVVHIFFIAPAEMTAPSLLMSDSTSSIVRLRSAAKTCPSPVLARFLTLRIIRSRPA